MASIQHPSGADKHQPQPALIFIPDISGFTHFVSNTEIAHSKHIIEELLEILIEANTLGLHVSEIEGDAILFYRFGQAPTAAELLNQVQQMFVRFHTHLKKYESHRICNCGACSAANVLTLKFVAHYGEITTNQVKEHQKLFGKEVIVSHRLLKNDIAHHEYALFTNPLVSACSNWVTVNTVAWAEVEQSEQEYDSGRVQYCFLPLASLIDYIPALEPADYRIKGHTTHLFCSKAQIQAPLEMVFNIISDLPWRAKWIVGALPEVQELNHSIFQEGSTHLCLANGPVTVSHDFQHQQDTVSFTETNQARDFSVVYTLYREKDGSTRLEANAYAKRHFFKNLFFQLFVKRAYRKVYDQTWINLEGYCQSLINQGKTHEYMIVLNKKAA
ncbi:MAG TPA: DUF2652 domain-containing protein [Saprospiraceae bacterium]|nr:DUF2652 domain-containing protein [Saprospiraceae bacterium]HMQ84724.1 DUF2652 domain-containing protein [Saprospiraceae bacterium]